MSSRFDAYAAVCNVLGALPSSHHGHWWSVDDLARILSTGGAENVNKEIVLKALNNKRSGTFRRDRTRYKKYFMLGEPIQKGRSVERHNQASTLDLNLLPKTSTNCFKAKPLLANVVKIIEDHDWTLPTPLARDSKNAAHVQNHIQYKNWADNSPGGKECEKENKAPNVDSCGVDNDSSSNDKCPSGFFLQSMNEDVEWTFKVHEHAKTCRGALSLVVRTKKKGWGKIAQSHTARSSRHQARVSANVTKMK
jgi:hypothetical protein